MTITETGYTPEFYHQFRDLAFSSAREILPHILSMVQVESAVNIGCGTGVWLSVCKELGIKDILGLDGLWIQKENLEIPSDCFQSIDLNQPIQLGRKFDLFISLEVAEHLPLEKANTFIDSLTSLGDIILFSAAIPGQGGVNHINLQWQDWWSKLYEKRGYLPVDFLRQYTWNNPRVSTEYAQNIVLYVNKKGLQNNSKLNSVVESTRLNTLSVVHPKFYQGKINQSSEVSLKEAIKIFGKSFSRFIKKRLQIKTK